jgi:hypothetical protein
VKTELYRGNICDRKHRAHCASVADHEVRSGGRRLPNAAPDFLQISGNALGGKQADRNHFIRPTVTVRQHAIAQVTRVVIAVPARARTDSLALGVTHTVGDHQQIARMLGQ